MKARRVTLTLEVETDVKVSDLRNAKAYLLRVVPKGGYETRVSVLQAQANVIQKEAE